MAVEITSLDQLTEDQVTALQDEYVQLVNERHPEIDLSGGVFHDLIAHFAGGISGAINQAKIDQYLRARSLLALNEDAELADTDLVDDVLSNFLVTRKIGTAATGEITITVSSDAAVVVSNGAIFSAGGSQFKTEAAYTARPSTSTSTLADTERRLTPLSDGTFAFTIPVIAVDAGTVSNIRRGTTVTPQIPPDRFVRAYTATDFTGGTATETNSEALDRLQEGVAAKCMQGRTNIVALLREQEDLESVLQYQVIGYGNAELLRSQHTILPIALPGYIDIYARSSEVPQQIQLTKTATYVDSDDEGTIWQFSITRDNAPGFYEVDQVIPQGEDADAHSGFEVLSTTRGVDLSDDGDLLIPDITATIEGVFTRFQTAVVRFRDTETASTNLTLGVSTQDYDVFVTVAPLIQDVQAFCSGSEVRNLTGDVLVRAAVPCFLTLTCEIHKAADTADVDIESIQTQLASAVNSLNFPGQLHASYLAAVIHSNLQSRQAVGPIEMFGRILLPDGTNVYLRDTHVLELPDRYDVMATPLTIAFYLDPSDIAVTAVNKGFGLTA